MWDLIPRERLSNLLHRCTLAVLQPDSRLHCTSTVSFGSKAAYSVRAEILAAILAVTPSFAADPDNGERLAHRWCTSCHVVASNQRGPTGEAPPFKTIVAQRSPTLMPQARIIPDGPASQDAKYATIPNRSVRFCGVHCNAQITRQFQVERMSIFKTAFTQLEARLGRLFRARTGRSHR